MFNLDDPRNLAYGLLAGIVFGFLLQRSGITRYRVILGQLLMARHVMLRVMLTAIVVGSVGILAMHRFWDVGLHVKSTMLLANVVGGLVLGVGMALLGYCPGTGIGAMGEGSRHAIPGVLGMLLGAACYAEAYPWIKQHVLTVGNYQKVTLGEITHLSAWFFVIALAFASVVVFLLLRNRDLPEAK